MFNFSYAALEFVAVFDTARDNYAAVRRVTNAELVAARIYRGGCRPSNRNRRDTAERNYLMVR